MISITVPIIQTDAWVIVAGFFFGWAAFLAFRLAMSLITG